jgi:hypothetical protein
MPATTLPAKTYADAYPYLRAPYTPNLIRFHIRTVPDQTSSPCVVVLYVKSETVMDRFNIVCGADWTPPVFTILVQREEKHGETTTHYVKMRATFTVYGTVYRDTAEATSESEVQAEYDANAQAFKRAARWPGIGQSLYQPDAIKMFRGPGKDQLRTWSNNPKKPHIDEKSEQFLLDHYEKLLAEKMIPVYGQPFDHLKALNGSATTLTQIVAPTTALPPPAGSQQFATGEQQPTPVSSDAAAQPSVPPAPARQRSATGKDMAAIRAAAQRAGYTDALSETLMSLARENDESPLAAAYAECVAGWIGVLGARQVEESKILEAVTFALDNCATRQGAQVKFGQWVAAKATAPATELPAPVPAPADLATGSQSSPPETAGAAAPDMADPQVELAAATRDLQEAIARHDYTERAAARIAALAIGADPDRKIDLAKIPPGTLRCVGELLDAAATLEWSTGKLDEEISRAHNSTQQETSASRFGAFAIHLINSAEARVEEDARAAAAASAAA